MELHGSIRHIVTGGAQRMGKAIALALAQAGAEVIITYQLVRRASAGHGRPDQTIGRARGRICV